MLLLLETNFLHLILPVAFLLVRVGWPPPLPRTHPFHRGEGGWWVMTMTMAGGVGGGPGTWNIYVNMYIVYTYIYIHVHTYTYMYLNQETKHTIFGASQKCQPRILHHHLLWQSKKTQKKHEKRTQSLFGIRQVFPMRQVSWAKVSGCFEFHQLIIAAFSLPKGSKVKHSWVLYTLQWGFGVANNKWLWNGPHAVIFFHNHFHTNLQMKLSRSHEMHSSGWELTHTPPHVTF